MAIKLQPEETDTKRIVQALNEAVDGRHNASGRVTLTPGTTTTVVEHPNCSADCEPQLSPRTANAAAALATTYPSSVRQGSFVITHANSATTDRTFGFTVTGG